MDEKLVEKSMELILCAGNGKAMVIDAVKKLLAGGSVDEARKQILMAGKEIGKAHEIQTSLLQAEINGQVYEKTILLIHAQDHFMNALTIRDMASLIIDMVERFKNNAK